MLFVVVSLSLSISVVVLYLWVFAGDLPSWFAEWLLEEPHCHLLHLMWERNIALKMLCYHPMRGPSGSSPYGQCSMGGCLAIPGCGYTSDRQFMASHPLDGRRCYKGSLHGMKFYDFLY
jgi:hypothetical protein